MNVILAVISFINSSSILYCSLCPNDDEWLNLSVLILCFTPASFNTVSNVRSSLLPKFLFDLSTLCVLRRALWISFLMCFLNAFVNLLLSSFAMLSSNLCLDFLLDCYNTSISSRSSCLLMLASSSF